jgi:hypothetical protein
LNASDRLRRLEAIIDASGVPARVEALLPVGVRPRQLSVRTLLLGMLTALSDGRPAHLRRVHEALRSLPAQQQWRLGVLAQWKTGPHLLTYRQVERTFMLILRALSKEKPDGTPSETLAGIIDALLQASHPNAPPRKRESPRAGPGRLRSRVVVSRHKAAPFLRRGRGPDAPEQISRAQKPLYVY